MNFFLLSLLLSVSSVFSQNCSTDYSSDIQRNIDNGCQWNWKYFDRPSGGWCMKVFTGNVSKSDAESACNAQNATLSGLQNPSELSFVNFFSGVLMQPQSGTVWLGIKRTDACMTSRITSACSRNTSFEWTDGSATGTDGFVWQLNQPDNSGAGSKIYSDCAVLFVKKPTYTGGDSYKIMDDVPCIPPWYTFDSDSKIQGYVCGKKAQLTSN